MSNQDPAAVTERILRGELKVGQRVRAGDGRLGVVVSNDEPGWYGVRLDDGFFDLFPDGRYAPDELEPIDEEGNGDG